MKRKKACMKIRGDLVRGIFIEDEVHYRLKVFCAINDVDIYKVASDAIIYYLDELEKNTDKQKSSDVKKNIKYSLVY